MTLAQTGFLKYGAFVLEADCQILGFEIEYRFRLRSYRLKKKKKINK